jgi:hypothetical protein
MLGRRKVTPTTILLQHVAADISEQKSCRHMNLPDNGAHAGPSHHQEDRSFTGRKVGAALAKCRKAKSYHVLVWRQHGLEDYRTDMHFQARVCGA